MRFQDSKAVPDRVISDISAAYQGKQRLSRKRRTLFCRGKKTLFKKAEVLVIRARAKFMCMQNARGVSLDSAGLVMEKKRGDTVQLKRTETNKGEPCVSPAVEVFRV